MREAPTNTILTPKERTRIEFLVGNFSAMILVRRIISLAFPELPPLRVIQVSAAWAHPAVPFHCRCRFGSHDPRHQNRSLYPYPAHVNSPIGNTDFDRVMLPLGIELMIHVLVHRISGPAHPSCLHLLVFGLLLVLSRWWSRFFVYLHLLLPRPRLSLLLLMAWRLRPRRLQLLLVVQLPSSPHWGHLRPTGCEVAHVDTHLLFQLNMTWRTLIIVSNLFRNSPL